MKFTLLPSHLSAYVCGGVKGGKQQDLISLKFTEEPLKLGEKVAFRNIIIIYVSILFMKQYKFFI